MKVRGKCQKCGYETDEHLDEWSSLKSSLSELEPTSERTKESIRSIDFRGESVRSKPSRFRRFFWDAHRDMVLERVRDSVDYMLVICPSCGIIGVRSRVRPKRDWLIPYAIAYILTHALIIALVGSFVGSLCLLIVLLSLLNVLVLFGYHLVTEIKGKWNMDACEHCGYSPAIPAFAALDLKVPCPECGERSFKLSGRGEWE